MEQPTEIAKDAVEIAEKRGPGRPRKSKRDGVFEKKATKARAQLEANKGDVERLLFRQIKAFEWAQDAWINGMTRGAASGQNYLLAADAEQGLKLATTLEKLVDTHSRYLKQQKEIGARFTEEELLESRIQAIMALDTKPRREVLRRMVDEHHALTNGKHDRGELGKLRSPGFKALENEKATDAIAALVEGL